MSTTTSHTRVSNNSATVTSTHKNVSTNPPVPSGIMTGGATKTSAVSADPTRDSNKGHLPGEVVTEAQETTQKSSS